jgi:hypothetical protein
MQELKYAVIPTGSALQRDIQLAGHVTKCQDLESEIAKMSKPNDSHPRNDSYNALARKLNRQASNPNGGLAAWETTKKEVLSYFDSRLPVYADPEGGVIPSKGYILNTRACLQFIPDAYVPRLVRGIQEMVKLQLSQFNCSFN